MLFLESLSLQLGPSRFIAREEGTEKLYPFQFRAVMPIKEKRLRGPERAFSLFFTPHGPQRAANLTRGCAARWRESLTMFCGTETQPRQRISRILLVLIFLAYHGPFPPKTSDRIHFISLRIAYSSSTDQSSRTVIWSNGCRTSSGTAVHDKLLAHDWPKAFTYGTEQVLSNIAVRTRIAHRDVKSAMQSCRPSVSYSSAYPDRGTCAGLSIHSHATVRTQQHSILLALSSKENMQPSTALLQPALS
ncbi:hypothetical protein KC327_g81 [Hortaea werneckii]|nr:hypothetical protein KC327_g81 [Hortaea werneckii]